MRFTIRTPDDFHVHLRDGDMLRSVLPATAAHFARALVMPNLKPPVVNADDAVRYRTRIMRALDRVGFEPLMTIKLLDSTTPTIIEAAIKAGIVAAKLYPRGATTGAEDGVTDIFALKPVFKAMQDVGMVLCLHGEQPGVFVLDREQAFLNTLTELAMDFPRLRVVLEHVTTAAAVEHIEALPANIGATITAHHLYLTLDDVVGSGLRPHNYCMPVAKRADDRRALIDAATSGNPKFFFGSDSAPHSKETKECACGAAGVFTAPHAISLLADVFDQVQRLPRLEAFTSEFGARFYGLPFNSGRLTLDDDQDSTDLRTLARAALARQEANPIVDDEAWATRLAADLVAAGEVETSLSTSAVVHFRAGMQLKWRVASRRGA